MKKIIVINLIVVISLIFLLEIFANIFKLSGLMGMDANLLFKKNGVKYFKPNSTGKIFNKKVFIDKYGYRVPSLNYNYTGKKNILILGDSQTFGNGVSEEKTFVGILRKQKKNINFYNASVPGYQFKDHSENFKEFKNFYKIDKIIYFYTLNDVLGSARSTEEEIVEGDHKLKKIKIFQFLNFFLRDKSYLYMFIKGVSSDPSMRWYKGVENFYLSKNISHASDFFNELKLFSKEQNSDLLVFILPYEYQLRTCKNDSFIPQAKISEILSNKGIKFFDLSRQYCGKIDLKNFFYKFDAAHFSVLGHKFTSEIINEKINF